MSPLSRLQCLHRLSLIVWMLVAPRRMTRVPRRVRPQLLKNEQAAHLHQSEPILLCPWHKDVRHRHHPLANFVDGPQLIAAEVSRDRLVKTLKER